MAKGIKQLINARFADGETIEDFKIVHRKMHKAWKDDPKMRVLIRPQTLYTGNFQSYLNWPINISEYYPKPKMTEIVNEPVETITREEVQELIKNIGRNF